jgi:hypothetical protein
VVPLEAATTKVAVPPTWTVWFVGWVVMTGGGPARAFRTKHDQHVSRQRAACSVPKLAKLLICAVVFPVCMVSRLFRIGR